MSVKKESHFISKEVDSIELSLDSWLKVEISPPETELEENQSTEENLKMRTSQTSILVEEFSQWPTLDQEPTDPNSSYALVLPLILMELTLSSDKLLMDLLYLMLSRPIQLETTMSQEQKLLSLTADNCDKTQIIYK